VFRDCSSESGRFCFPDSFSTDTHSIKIPSIRKIELKKITKKTAPKKVGKINADVRVILRKFDEPIDWIAVKKHFKGKCVYCGVNGKKVEIIQEHAIPVNAEHLGLSRPGNIIPACRQCNNDKASKHYIDFCRYPTKKGKIAKRGRDAERDITEYMKSEGYKKLGKNETERDTIRKIISKSREATGKIRNEAKEKIEKVIAKKPTKKTAK